MQLHVTASAYLNVVTVEDFWQLLLDVPFCISFPPFHPCQKKPAETQTSIPWWFFQKAILLLTKVHSFCHMDIVRFLLWVKGQAIIFSYLKPIKLDVHMKENFCFCWHRLMQNLHNFVGGFYTADDLRAGFEVFNTSNLPQGLQYIQNK